MESEKGLKVFLKSKMLSLLLFLVALIVIFMIWSAVLGARFLTSSTIISIIDMLVVTSFLAIGAGCLMIAGHVDLSASAIGAFGGVFVAACMKYWGIPWPVAIILTLVICGFFGFINGLLVNMFNFESFIATLAMSYVAKGLMMAVSVDPVKKAAMTVSYNNPAMSFFGSYKIGGAIPLTITVMVVAFIFYGLLLSKTKFGTSVYMVGGNPLASRLSGLNPKKIVYILFINSGALAGVSGIILMARTQQGNLTALSTNQFTGMTAALLGGISFGGGTGGMAGVFVGLVILNTFNKGMTIVNFDAFWTTVLTGAILIAALTLDYVNGRRALKGALSKQLGENRDGGGKSGEAAAQEQR